MSDMSAHSSPQLPNAVLGEVTVHAEDDDHATVLVARTIGTSNFTIQPSAPLAPLRLTSQLTEAAHRQLTVTAASPGSRAALAVTALTPPVLVDWAGGSPSGRGTDRSRGTRRRAAGSSCRVAGKSSPRCEMR